MKAHDYQREKVYAWENEVVGPRDPFPPVAFDNAQTIVSAIWMAKGLIGPPRVEPLPTQTRKAMAKGSRVQILLPPSVPHWVLIHEIAHAMTSTIETSALHGPDFVGVYMDLLETFLKVPKPLLWYTAQKAGIDFNPFAQPSFVDAA